MLLVELLDPRQVDQRLPDWVRVQLSVIRLLCLQVLPVLLFAALPPVIRLSEELLVSVTDHPPAGEHVVTDPVALGEHAGLDLLPHSAHLTLLHRLHGVQALADVLEALVPLQEGRVRGRPHRPQPRAIQLLLLHGLVFVLKRDAFQLQVLALLVEALRATDGVEVAFLKVFPRADAKLVLLHLDFFLLAGLQSLGHVRPLRLPLGVQGVELVDVVHVHVPLLGTRLGLDPLQLAATELAHGRLELRDLEGAAAVIIEAVDHVPHILQRQLAAGLGQNRLHLVRRHGLVALLQVRRVVVRVPEKVCDPHALLVHQLLDCSHRLVCIMRAFGALGLAFCPALPAEEGVVHEDIATHALLGQLDLGHGSALEVQMGLRFR
mmetsp:Transcript_123679/g.311497  ORF Transcript_123679/g.311497 Transcript_123679/m.311497 type:complete len:378 (-) Transcript_123679:1144-2277(-)